MPIRVDLRGTSIRVISSIIDNNTGNGVPTSAVIYDGSGNAVCKFSSKPEYYSWWKTQYGGSDVGMDDTYIMINFP